jgi:protein-L-isoaspartate O-methyltransferase
MPQDHSKFDADTFEFYANNADEYAARRQTISHSLLAFLNEMPKGARILEIGCGAGLEAQYMCEQGFDVLATEGNPKLGAHAQKRLGERLKIMRFDEINFANQFDGIWANMCLLHAPWESLPDILHRLKAALKPNGILMASFKEGEGPKRDRLGRYYNLPTEDELAALFDQIGFSTVTIRQGDGGVGHDGEPYEVLWCAARK